MHVVRLLVWLAVKINDAVLYLQRLSRKSYTSLYVILSAVCRAAHYVAIFVRIIGYITASCSVCELVILTQLHIIEGVELWMDAVLLEYLLTISIYHLIVVLWLPSWFADASVAGRIIEHHNIIELHLAKSWRTTVVPLWPLYV